LAPENTAAAFDVALAYGSHVLETDVRMSRDGVLFVTHDEVLQRTTNGHGKVRDQLACELDALNAGYHFTDLQGRNFRNDGIRLMRLDALFERYPHCGINIDIKDVDPAAAIAVAKVIARYPDHQDVNVGSFHHSIMKHFRKASPQTSTAATRQEVAALYFGKPLVRPPEQGRKMAAQSIAEAPAAEPLAPRSAKPYQCLQIPTRYGPFKLASQRLLNKAGMAGVKVIYWTINEACEMQSLLDLGADGIVTDRPDIAASLQAFKLN